MTTPINNPDDWLMINKAAYNTIKNLIDDWGTRPPQANTRDIRLNIKHIIENNFHTFGDIK